MIEIHTLTDGGQEPLEVAQRLAGFLSAAQKTLDVAIYDIRLPARSRTSCAARSRTRRRAA